MRTRFLALAALCLLPLQAANEIQITATLLYANPASSIANQQLAVTKYVTIAGLNFVSSTFSVPTSAGGTAIPISNLTTVGWFFIKNLDATNYVDILTAGSGTAFARILPGEGIMLRLTPAITAPAALAHTAPVSIQYLALEN